MYKQGLHLPVLDSGLVLHLCACASRRARLYEGFDAYVNFNLDLFSPAHIMDVQTVPAAEYRERGIAMQKDKIERIVDCAFDKALAEIQVDVNRELYPAAFANEYSWLHVQKLFHLNNAAMRNAVKEALSEILGDLS